MKTFRFDDCSIRSDSKKEFAMMDFLSDKFPGCRIIQAVSPLISDLSNESNDITKQRIFPKIWNAYSDYRIFYNVDLAGIPPVHPNARAASHGLTHCDARLLTRECEEMSILISCSLLKSKIYVPPFNKTSKYTQEICDEHNIELIKFEDGWLCMEYNEYNPAHDLWYLHAREFTFEKFKKWFDE